MHKLCPFRRPESVQATASGGIDGGRASRKETERVVSDKAVASGSEFWVWHEDKDFQLPVMSSDRLSQHVNKSEDGIEEGEYGQGIASSFDGYLRDSCSSSGSFQECALNVDRNLLKIGKKISSGSSGELFIGTYADEEVAVKVLYPAKLKPYVWIRFEQEICSLRKLDHPNIVRLIGSSSNTTQFCIITEYMSKGSLFDFLHNEFNILDLSTLLRFALDICRGMCYLHQKGIIHKNLKSANILMDKNHISVRPASRIVSVMTTRTGSYRWMAPEVLNFEAYDKQSDVYSFSIVLWELMTSKIPYSTMSPHQAGVEVVQGLRPELPKNVEQRLLNLMQRCWEAIPSNRPSFSDIITELEYIKTQYQTAGGRVLRIRRKKGFQLSTKKIVYDSRRVGKQSSLKKQEEKHDKTMSHFHSILSAELSLLFPMMVAIFAMETSWTPTIQTFAAWLFSVTAIFAFFGLITSTGLMQRIWVPFVSYTTLFITIFSMGLFHYTMGLFIPKIESIFPDEENSRIGSPVMNWTDTHYILAIICFFLLGMIGLTYVWGLVFGTPKCFFKRGSDRSSKAPAVRQSGPLRLQQPDSSETKAGSGS